MAVAEQRCAASVEIITDMLKDGPQKMKEVITTIEFAAECSKGTIDQGGCQKIECRQEKGLQRQRENCLLDMGTPPASDGHVGFHEESTGERKYNTVTGGNRNALGERCWGSLLALPGGSKASYGVITAKMTAGIGPKSL